MMVRRMRSFMVAMLMMGFRRKVVDCEYMMEYKYNSLSTFSWCVLDGDGACCDIECHFETGSLKIIFLVELISSPHPTDQIVFIGVPFFGAEAEKISCLQSSGSG